MDGLASLAAAADLLGEYETDPTGEREVMSPSKQKRGASNPETPKKKRQKKGPSSPMPLRSPHRAPALQMPQENLPFQDEESPMPTATTIDLERHGLGTKSLLSSITQRFSANVLHWCTYEWFYTTLDREYFNENEFIACLRCLGVNEVTRLARSEWSAVRTIMGSKIGRPRRFSSAFVKSERRKLHDYRNSVRAIQSGRQNFSQDFSHDVFPPITVGDCVTAYHAESGLLLRGQVLTLETCYPEGTPSYRVQFEYPVMFTGIVRDEDLAVHGELISASTKCDGIEDTDAPDNASAAVCGEERRQWEHAATLQYFLDRKEYLLESLKVLNNLAEQELLQRTQSESSSGGIAESQFTDNFLQQHQWVIDNVVRSDHIIAQLLQQLSNDATLYGKEVISPPSPSEDNSVIQSEWILQYESLSNVSVPAPVRDQNPARLFLSGDARQASPQNLTRVEFRNSKESSTIDDYSSRKEDFSSVLELYKICVCCLALLKKFQLEEFCRPKDLCVFLVSKVDGYNDVLPMRNVVQKIEAICFGLS